MRFLMAFFVLVITLETSFGKGTPTIKFNHIQKLHYIQIQGINISEQALKHELKISVIHDGGQAKFHFVSAVKSGRIVEMLGDTKLGGTAYVKSLTEGLKDNGSCFEFDLN